MVTTEIPFCRALPVPVMLAKYIAQFPVTISLAGNRFFCISLRLKYDSAAWKNGFVGKSATQKSNCLSPCFPSELPFYGYIPSSDKPKSENRGALEVCDCGKKSRLRAPAPVWAQVCFHHGGSTPLITLRQSNIAIDMVVFHGYVNDYHRGYGHNVQNDASNQWTLGYIFRQTQTSTESAVLAV